MLVTFSLLIGIFLLLLLSLLVVHLIAAREWQKPRETIILETTRYCSPNLDSLINLDLKQPICCQHNGIFSGEYAVTHQGINYSVSATPRYFGQVCRELCSLGSTLDELGNVTCLNGDTAGQTLANVCVSNLRPVNCVSSALPIAIREATPYYASHAASFLGISQCVASVCP